MSAGSSSSAAAADSLSAVPSTLPAWRSLQSHVSEIDGVHLKNLVDDPNRYAVAHAEFDNVFVDFSRQRVTAQTLNLLFDLAEQADVQGKIKKMASGAHLNSSEDRAVMHLALRSHLADAYTVDGVDASAQVHAVLKKIYAFAADVRGGKWLGATGKPLTNVVAIGIGGSYLGAQFVAEALKNDAEAAAAAKGREIRFLANVDPVGVTRALDGLQAEHTLVIVISKTFTTRETMLNARTVRKWIVDKLGEKAVAKHVVAVSTNLKDVAAFGIDPKNAFEFWDWVGGRYSVTSAVGVLPLALHYGEKLVTRFLDGCRSIDQNFLHSKPRENLPLILGLLGVWNSSFLGLRSRALIPYSEALHKLAPHIQQVDMESNGKRVTLEGKAVDFPTGEVNFGEPGTNSQHSFFQLIHQGQHVPVDFIGFAESQTPIDLKEDDVPNHDELMANFFAQPDALAFGKGEAELKAEGVPAKLIPHRLFPGNRPSTVILLQKLTAYEVGQLLSLYEHRTAVQGFIWGINSFDQFGVELGKVLATKVRASLKSSRKSGAAVTGFNVSTTNLLNRYLAHKSAKL